MKVCCLSTSPVPSTMLGITRQGSKHCGFSFADEDTESGTKVQVNLESYSAALATSLYPLKDVARGKNQW